jgi:ABC-type transport system involved in multi-copper enzyme maturation permease subunit
MTRLIRSEVLKIRTTNPWWIFGLGLIVTTGLALWFNLAQASYYLSEEARHVDTADLPSDQAGSVAAQMAAQTQVATQAANIFTSGQYFAGLFVMMIAILMVTNEYYHQTATATFLTTPLRSAVVTAKLITAALVAVVYWVVSTVISIGGGLIFFNVKHVDNHLDTWSVQRAILFNLLVFVLWAVLGVGFGALIRNQIGATITAAVLYTVGSQVVGVVFFVIRQFLIKEDWVLKLAVVVPSEAARVFVTAVQLPESAPYWVGGLVLLAYGVVGSVAGSMIMRRRDIS